MGQREREFEDERLKMKGDREERERKGKYI